LVVKEEFDYVLVDTSPIGIVSDPIILASQGDGVLLVLDGQNTRKDLSGKPCAALKL
jgi:Mrp family chromosome partitioning ATPase